MSGWEYVKSKKRNANSRGSEKKEKAGSGNNEAGASVSRSSGKKKIVSKTMYQQMEEALEEKEVRAAMARETGGMGVVDEVAERKEAEREARRARRKAKDAAARKAHAAALAALRPVGAVLAATDVAGAVGAAKANFPASFMAQGRQLATALEAELASSVPVAEMPFTARTRDNIRALHATMSEPLASAAAAAPSALAHLVAWVDSGAASLLGVAQLFHTLVDALLNRDSDDNSVGVVSWNGTRLLVQLLARRFPVVVAVSSDSLVRATEGKNRKSYSFDALYVAAQLGRVGALALLAQVAAVPASSGSVWASASAGVLSLVATTAWEDLAAAANPDGDAAIVIPSLPPTEVARIAKQTTVLLDGVASSDRIATQVARMLVHAVGDACGGAGASWLIRLLLPYATHPHDGVRTIVLTDIVRAIGASPRHAIAELKADYATKVGPISNVLSAVYAALASGSAATVEPALDRLVAFCAHVAEKNATLLERGSFPAQLAVQGLDLTPEIIDVCSDNAGAVASAIVDGLPSSASVSSSSSYSSASASSCSCCSLIRSTYSAARFAAHKALLFGLGLGLGYGLIRAKFIPDDLFH